MENKDQGTWKFPLRMNYKGTTNDSYSFLDLDLENEVEIPILPHVGAFGIRRRYDHHCGVDLYAPEGTEVFAVEDGEVVDICPFTGPSAGYDFWLDTEAIYVRGVFGIVVYGEIKVNSKLKIGDKIKAESFIGNVKRVIKKDKGRPMSMLHLELHHKDHIHVGHWHRGEKKPFGKLDPVNFLINSKKYNTMERRWCHNVIAEMMEYIPSPMKEWEYKVLSIFTTKDIETLKEQFNSFRN